METPPPSTTLTILSSKSVLSVCQPSKQSLLSLRNLLMRMNFLVRKDETFSSLERQLIFIFFRNLLRWKSIGQGIAFTSRVTIALLLDDQLWLSSHRILKKEIAEEHQNPCKHRRLGNVLGDLQRAKWTSAAFDVLPLRKPRELVDPC